MTDTDGDSGAGSAGDRADRLSAETRVGRAALGVGETPFLVLERDADAPARSGPSPATERCGW